MILYLAGSEQERQDLLERLCGCNLLCSYAYNPERVLDIPHTKLGSLSFVDSGAFTSWTQGKIIDVDTYINWINEHSDLIDLYGQVDTIPGLLSGTLNRNVFYESAKKSWENYLYMRPKMKNPDGLLYTYHAGEPINYLKNALEFTDEHGNFIPYIALAGVVGNPRVVKYRFFEECFNVIKHSSNPNVKVHAFGLTDFSLLEQFPITSSDSTSWVMCGAMGYIVSDFGPIQISSKRSYSKKHYLNFSHDMKNCLLDTITKLGFTAEELMDSRDNRIVYNALYMTDRANRLNNSKPNKLYKKKLF